MAQAYNAIIATIVVAGDATSVTKTMVKSTTWRAGTSGDWSSSDCTLTAGNTYQFRTPLSGMDDGSTAILPDIKASVTVAWDTSATLISTVGDNFMNAYARLCYNLTSLSVPDTSGLTSIGNYFMNACAYRCYNLTSLSVPDISGLTSVSNYFMSNYAGGCSNLTSLSVPDTSGLTKVGMTFLYNYANGCSSLTSLSVPDTSGLITEGATVGTYFMSGYASNCTSLTKLMLPENPAYFKDNNISWSVPEGRLTYLKGYVLNATSKTAWEALTAEGKTLYLNYIRDNDNIVGVNANINANSDEISLTSQSPSLSAGVNLEINSDEVLLTSLNLSLSVGVNIASDEVLFTSLSPSLIAGVNVSANSDEISLTSLSPSLNVSVGIDSDEISLTSLGIDSFSVSKDLTAIAFSIINPAVGATWDYLFINKPKNTTDWSSKSKNSTTWIKRPKVLTNWEEI